MKNEFIKRAYNCEKQNYQKQILEKFFQPNDFDEFHQNFYEYAIATQSFCFLLDFIYQHNPNLIHKISAPKIENCNDRLILANHSLKQLNIINDCNVSNNNSKFLCQQIRDNEPLTSYPGFSIWSANEILDEENIKLKIEEKNNYNSERNESDELFTIDNLSFGNRNLINIPKEHFFVNDIRDRDKVFEISVLASRPTC